MGLRDGKTLIADGFSNAFDSVTQFTQQFTVSNPAAGKIESASDDTIATATPDVLWVEFNGGPMYDWDEYWNDQDFPPPARRDNVALVLTDQDGVSGSMTMALELAIIGIGATGNVLAIHHLDLINGGAYLDWAGGPPPWPGILAPGHSYAVKLDDPGTVGTDWTFPELLTAGGTNPNG